MPVYCYHCDGCGRVTDLLARRPVSPPAIESCEHCGQPARRSYDAEAGRSRNASLGELRSVAAGVMPAQAAEAERTLAARGVSGVCFDRRTGDAVFRDRAAKLRALRAMHLHDKDEIRG